MAKAGRPKKEISKEQFEKLCGLQCTKEEIAGFFNCSPDTIENFCKRTYNDNFSAVYKEYSSQGKISLRRYQFKLAEKSAAMAIFLGKNMLGQSDKDDVQLELLRAQLAYTKAKLDLLTGADSTTLDKLDMILKEMRENADIEPETE